MSVAATRSLRKKTGCIQLNGYAKLSSFVRSVNRLLPVIAADVFCFLWFLNLILFCPGQRIIWTEVKNPNYILWLSQFGITELN